MTTRYVVSAADIKRLRSVQHDDGTHSKQNANVISPPQCASLLVSNVSQHPDVTHTSMSHSHPPATRQAHASAPLWHLPPRKMTAVTNGAKHTNSHPSALTPALKRVIPGTAPAPSRSWSSTAPAPSHNPMANGRWTRVRTDVAWARVGDVATVCHCGSGIPRGAGKGRSWNWEKAACTRAMNAGRSRWVSMTPTGPCACTPRCIDNDHAATICAINY